VNISVASSCNTKMVVDVQDALMESGLSAALSRI